MEDKTVMKGGAKMLRFLHISDIHFDAIYGRYPEVVRSALKTGVNRAFEKAVSFCIDQDLDLLVISGDICDKGTLSYATERFVKSQLERLMEAGVPVVALHGNHDPSSSLHWTIENSSLHFIKDSECKSLNIRLRSGKQVRVHANGFKEKAETLSRIETFPEKKDENYHIGAMHTYTASGLSTSEHEPYMKTNLSELSAKNYDYWALGHIHKMQLWPSYKIAYSGSLQGLHANEVGEKGGILVEIDQPGSQPTLTFVDFSVIEFQSIFVDIDDVQNQNTQNQDDFVNEMTLHQVRKKINLEIENMKALSKRKKSYLVRVFLEGRTSHYEALQKNHLLDELANHVREEAGVLFVEIIKDRIQPFINKDEILLASPFAKFIDDMLKDAHARQTLFDYAKNGEFAEKPDHDTEWFEKLVEDIGDEWLYKMVKKDEN